MHGELLKLGFSVAQSTVAKKTACVTACRAHLRYRRNAITQYGNRIAILSKLTEPRTPDACGGATGHERQMARREVMERFDMSRPMHQIGNSRTKPLQTEHHRQMSYVFGAHRRSKSLIKRWAMSIAPPKGKALFSKLWIKFSCRRKLAETDDLLRLSAGATIREDADYRRDLIEDTTFLYDRRTTETSFAMCAAACMIPIAFIG
jgi:hypothetical protein